MDISEVRRVTYWQRQRARELNALLLGHIQKFEDDTDLSVIGIELFHDDYGSRSEKTGSISIEVTL